MEIKNKKILVVGMARSGIAATILLCKLGAIPFLADTKGKESFGKKLQALEDYPVQWHLGVPPEELLPLIDMVVISPGVPINAAVVTKAEELGIPVIGELELGYKYTKGKLVALTGTNGKTTTASLVGEMFKNAGKVTHIVGNIGHPYSAEALTSKSEDVIVAEVSSFQLEGIKDFRPKVSAILNITPDHLDRHCNMENYISLKQRIYENQKNEDILVLNWEDEILQKIGKKLKGIKVVWFSSKEVLSQGAYVKNEKIYYSTDGEETLICNVDDVFIIGEHNLENALAATAIGMNMAVPGPVIRHTLRTFPGVEHRIERFMEKDGITYINDSKGTNVDATIKAIKAMKNKTIIILGGYDKQINFLPLAKEIANNENIVGAVLIGETAVKIEKVLLEAGYGNMKKANTLKEAVDTAKTMAETGYNILLSPACASFGMFEDYEQRGRVFKEIVKDSL